MGQNLELHCGVSGHVSSTASYISSSFNLHPLTIQIKDKVKLTDITSSVEYD